MVRSLGIICGLLLSFAVAFQSNKLELTVAYSSTTAPFHFEDERGEAQGIMIDILKLWAQEEGLTLHFVGGTWGESVEAVKSGQADIHAGLLYSSARDRFLDFTEPLHQSSGYIFHHKSLLGINSLDAIRSFKIGTIEGGVAADLIKKRLPEAYIIEYPNKRAFYDAAVNGDVRVIINEEELVLYRLKQRGIYDQFLYDRTKPLYTKEWHFAVPQGKRALLKRLKRGLASLPKESILEIRRKWIGGSESEANVPVVAFDLCPPYALIDARGRAAGLFVDLFKQWSETYDQPIRIVVNNAKTNRLGFEQGLYDAHIVSADSGIRKEQPFYLMETGFFIPHSKKAPHMMETGVRLGTTIRAAMTLLKKSLPTAQITYYNSASELFDAVEHGEVDAVYGERSSLIFDQTRLGRKGILEALPTQLKIGQLGFYLNYSQQTRFTNNVHLQIASLEYEALLKYEQRWLPQEVKGYFKRQKSDMVLFGSESQWLTSHNEIRYGYVPYAPFTFANEADGMMRAYFKHLETVLERSFKGIAYTTKEDLNRALQEGELDLVIDHRLKTEHQRRSDTIFTPFQFPLVAVTGKQITYFQSFEQLKGYHIGVMTDGMAEAFTKELGEEYYVAHYNSMEKMLGALSGEVDVWLTILPRAAYELKHSGRFDLKISGTFEASGITLLLTSANDTLASIIRKATHTLSESGVEAIIRPWVAVTYEKGVDYSLIWQILLGALVVIGVFIYWNRKIRRAQKEADEARAFVDAVFNSQEALVITRSSSKVIGVNKAFLRFFECRDIREFEEKYHRFESLFMTDKSDYIQASISGVPWYESIANSSDKRFKAAMRPNDKRHIFNVEVTAHSIGEDPLYTAVFHDITEMEELHTKLTDSIEYASIIQDTLLPEHVNMQHYFKDYFVIWQPKDTVGGDIYFFEELDENRCLLMVIDCTGHGVPGAFMTMLVKAVERTILTTNDGQTPSPAEILGQFNSHIKKLLRQDENSDSISNVGFDGAILYYDKRTREMRYAGAGVPLFILEEHEVKQIKPDRHSIGYRSSKNNYQFKEHLIMCKEGMQLFLTTDGYVDQNGGSKGFSFGKRAFKELLWKYQEYSMNDKKEVLLIELGKWQKSYERNDDVTLVGLCID